MKCLYSKTSLKYLSKLELRIRAKIVAAIDGLPDQGDTKKIRGEAIRNVYRLRVGKYRILYVRDEETIKIVALDTRGDICK